MIKVSRARGRTQQIVRKKGEEGTAATETAGVLLARFVGACYSYECLAPANAQQFDAVYNMEPITSTTAPEWDLLTALCTLWRCG